MLTGEFKEAVSLALSRGIDFAACALPSSDDYMLFVPALTPGSDEIAFETAPWLASYSERTVIGGLTRPEVAVKKLSALPPVSVSETSEPVRSTTREEYMLAVEGVISSCRARQGKTVMSRVISGEMTPGVSSDGIFFALCGAFPSTFRFIFHTRELGTWTGATPETLLSVDFSDNSFRTMSFAGTRRRVASTEPRPWDAKNLRENGFVTAYLTDCITASGLEASVGEPLTVAYGSEIEHLCCNISGKLGGLPYTRLLDAINPTPALCGSPKEAALADIVAAEHHSRGCYGGFVGLRTPLNFNAFVTLRCCRTEGRNMAIYAGGGITPDSVAENEWLETEAKSAFLRGFMNKNS